MMAWLLAAALTVTPAAGPTAPPAPEQVMAVPAELQVLLQEQVLDRTKDPAQRLSLLLQLMSGEGGALELRYEDNATLTVEEAYLQRRVNCLSYTLMFLALAQRAGLTAHPQEIDQTLSWQQLGDIVYRSNHVNAKVRNGGAWKVVDVAGGRIVARQPPHRIGEHRLLAQYYNNRAARLMEQGQLAEALRYAAIALALDPAYPVTWSNLGVIRLRSGNPAGAEQAYLKALALDPVHASALSNIDSLYRRLNLPDRAAPFRKRLEKVQRQDPFYHFMLATRYAQQGQHAQAIAHYRRAIRLYGDEPRFTLGLATAYLADGNRRSAIRLLDDALAASRDETRRAQYRAALEDLRAEKSW